jgi:hypothetical protein
MPKKQIEANQSSSQLIEALQFVSVAATKKDNLYQKHVMLNNGYAVMTDGQLTAGFPIVENLECCPQIGLLQTAVSKCKASADNPLSITELDNGSLSIKGEKLRALVPCISFEEMPGPPLTTPDENIAPITDELKKAFSVCGSLVSENGKSFIEASILLEANTCTSTNRQVLIQYWHGIDLPPNLLIPKIFAQAICRVKQPLTGFGYTENQSITFWFGEKVWIKTQLYEDKYPDVTPIIEHISAPAPVGKEFFDAIETVGLFSENGKIYFQNGKIVSHIDTNKGAQYKVGINKLLLRCYSVEHLKTITPFATEIDFNTYNDRAMFFGENLRGTIMAIVMLDDDEIPF